MSQNLSALNKSRCENECRQQKENYFLLNDFALFFVEIKVNEFLEF